MREIIQTSVWPKTGKFICVDQLLLTKKGYNNEKKPNIKNIRMEYWEKIELVGRKSHFLSNSRG
jgi:hypothetical protein